MPYSKKELKQLALDYIAGVADNYCDEVYCTPRNLAKGELETFFNQVFGFDLNSEQDPDIAVAIQGATFTVVLNGKLQEMQFVKRSDNNDLTVFNKTKLTVYDLRIDPGFACSIDKLHELIVSEE